MQRAREVVAVLHVQRLIEVKLMPNRREGVRIGFRAGHRDRGIGGDHERDREGDERGAEQNERAEKNSAKQVGEHPVLTSLGAVAPPSP